MQWMGKSPTSTHNNFSIWSNKAMTRNFVILRSDNFKTKLRNQNVSFPPQPFLYLCCGCVMDAFCTNRPWLNEIPVKEIEWKYNFITWAERLEIPRKDDWYPVWIEKGKQHMFTKTCLCFLGVPDCVRDCVAIKIKSYIIISRLRT